MHLIAHEDVIVLQADEGPYPLEYAKDTIGYDWATATTEDLDRHCRALIAGYKVPRRYEVHTRLPRTGAGKIDKARLREPHWRDHGRGVS